MPTMQEKMYESLKNIQIGTILTKKEIVNKIQNLFPDTPDSSITPQDACYNIVNIGRSEEPLFEWIKRNKYKYLGRNYPYNGDITHKSKDSGTIEKVGYWSNGKKVMTKDIFDSQISHSNHEIIYPDEVENYTLAEGAKKQVIVNAYERNPKARRECIKHYGTKCFLCGFDFEQVYGEIGKGFIHVHHIKPLAEINEEYEVNPIQDLRPVCPNCHAMIHKRKPAYSIEEIESLIKKSV